MIESNFKDKLEAIYNAWMNETRGFSTRREYFEFCFKPSDRITLENWLKAAIFEGYEKGLQDAKPSQEGEDKC